MSATRWRQAARGLVSCASLALFVLGGAVAAFADCGAAGRSGSTWPATVATTGSGLVVIVAAFVLDELLGLRWLTALFAGHGKRRSGRAGRNRP